MRSVVVFALWISCAASSVTAQDVLWYSFTDKSGAVPNRAVSKIRGPASATIVTKNKRGDRVDGIHKAAKGGGDYALASFDDWNPSTRRAKNYNYLDTGWKAELKGSVTIAFFVRFGIVTSSGGAQYVFGDDTGFRCFTEGRAKTGLSIAGWGGFGYIDLDYDLRGASAKGWVHVACVLDAKARKATWYIDGKVVSTKQLFGPIHLKPRKRGFRIGTNDTVESPNVWHIDDFRLAKGAKTADDLRVWRYESGKVGTGCGVSLQAAAGARPVLGSKSYDLLIQGQPKATSIVAIGFSDKKLAGALDLPIDLGKFIAKQLDSCQWYQSSDLLFAMRTDANGATKVPLPMPNAAALSGASLWVQALVTWEKDKKTNWQSSNAWRVVFVPR